MTNPDAVQRAVINRLATGVPGLDEALGGGLPEYSFNLIAGSPGTGKTTLSQQIMFHLATPERPALHFTVLGEPPLKMLRYQQQFSFFDFAKVEAGSVRFRNLSAEAMTGDLRAVLEAIRREVEQTNPALVIVDSFRTIIRAAARSATELDLPRFLQELALLLTSWQATTFLVGEYLDSETHDNPVFTIADGILWLHQTADRNSIVRKLQIVKMRGQSSLPGLHTIRISGDGIDVFPRIIRPIAEMRVPRPAGRLSLGIEALDEMMGGGIPAWDAVLVAGPSGSGKSALGMQFITAGLDAGEPGVIAVFEERPEEYLDRARGIGRPDLDEAIDRGLLDVLYMRPLDLSVDEALLEIRRAVTRTNAQRLTIDSLSGFELALAPTFRDDFRESLYRMVGALTGAGVTVFMTAEVPQSFTDLVFSPNLVSFLTDDLILQRYIELDGRLQKVMTVVKMRGSGHSQDIRLYDVTDDGLVIGETLADYSGVLTGVPVRHAARDQPDGS